MSSIKELQRHCEHAGLFMSIYKPGDGKARYRFWAKGDNKLAPDYFESTGLFTAVGLNDAFTFVAGYQRGMAQALYEKCGIIIGVTL